ncbi:ankyrin repeat domain-containing protein [Roseomonas sp. JC162]|uniref:Ankyrin repeat domain-containing protein n=1 Tax=Neoroseomonas marina TaxID=1232220 RepID=A0A848EBG2_9PROT|nr:ankyrin repeat domain-containing protein [Neoroseomonas marina]NMJ41366.1 ankyrin repeat domain-containing protein [Neoroseomonas marina]
MRRSLPLLAAGLVALGALPAAAQFAGPTPPTSTTTQQPPPPALPGLAARRAPEPIPADPNANLAPTAALFDAVNRGDLAAARDAVGRGASLEERNVLGMTAIDSAVDQGRNEILFYLLAARTTARGPTPPAEAALTPAQRAARDRAIREEAERSARAAAGLRGTGPTRLGPAPSTRPRLFANDGGAARPDIGFLGFDAGRSSGGAPAREARPRRG